MTLTRAIGILAALVSAAAGVTAVAGPAAAIGRDGRFGVDIRAEEQAREMLPTYPEATPEPWDPRPGR